MGRRHHARHRAVAARLADDRPRGAAAGAADRARERPHGGGHLRRASLHRIDATWRRQRGCPHRHPDGAGRSGARGLSRSRPDARHRAAQAAPRGDARTPLETREKLRRARSPLAPLRAAVAWDPAMQGADVMAFKERVFSGVQPTGNLHLGNYLGAIVKFVALQERYDCIYCVVDMHAITVWQDPPELKRSIREVTAAFIACGIDPQRHIVFNQSQVAEHAELAWIFNCVSSLGWINRMTQVKENAGNDR